MYVYTSTFIYIYIRIYIIIRTYVYIHISIRTLSSKHQTRSVVYLPQMHIQHTYNLATEVLRLLGDWWG